MMPPLEMKRIFNSLSVYRFNLGDKTNIALIAIFLFCFSSCGFEVIYRNEGSLDKPSYEKELAAIRIKKDRVRLNQELKNNLYDLLNPDYIKTEPKYFLIVTLNKSVSSTFITTTGASGRNKVTLSATYQLKSLKTGEIISQASTSVNDNYDVSSNRYGTYAADEFVARNLTKIVAQNIRNSLVNDFIELRRKSAEGEAQEALKDGQSIN